MEHSLLVDDVVSQVPLSSDDAFSSKFDGDFESRSQKNVMLPRQSSCSSSTYSDSIGIGAHGKGRKGSQLGLLAHRPRQLDLESSNSPIRAGDAGTGSSALLHKETKSMDPLHDGATYSKNEETRRDTEILAALASVIAAVHTALARCKSGSLHQPGASTAAAAGNPSFADLTLSRAASLCRRVWLLAAEGADARRLLAAAGACEAVAAVLLAAPAAGETQMEGLRAVTN
ncbi:unnamed protein product, partial [Phaeothamnion confervicola]